MADKPIPPFLMPTPVATKPIGRDSELLRRMAQDLDVAQEGELEEMSDTNALPRAPTMPAPPATPYAPARPAPTLPASNQAPASSMEVQFNGRTLRVNSTCNTATEMEQLIGALTALVPFLPKGEA